VSYSMGALSPYEYFNRIKPKIEELESSKGTLDYFDKYDIILPEIEQTREKIVRSLPPMLLGAAMMKIALDYYDSLDYETKDTDGTEIDTEYKIDLIAEKNDEVIVVQVKSGEISRQEFQEFISEAKKFLEEHHSSKKVRKLAVVADKLDSDADFSGIGKRLGEAEIGLEYEAPERIINELPKYRRHFKELREIHQQDS